MDSFAHDDEGLWDELNNQQSREIEQHHHNKYYNGGVGVGRMNGIRRIQRTLLPTIQDTETTPPFVSSIAHTVQQTTADVTTAIGSAWSRYKQSRNPTKTRYQYSTVHPNETMNDWWFNTTTTNTNHDNNPNQSLLSSQHHYHPMNEYQQQYNNNNNNNEYFVLLQQFRLLPRQEGWNAVSNLDLYFTSLYHYYYYRGYIPILMKGIVELITLFFTLFLSIFLAMYIDWKQLLECHDETTCKEQFADYLVPHPFTQTHNHPIKTLFVLIYILCLGIVYGIYSILTFLHSVQDAKHAQSIFINQLGISDRKLYGGSIDWDRDVVAKLIQLQTSGDYRIIINNNIATMNTGYRQETRQDPNQPPPQQPQQTPPNPNQPLPNTNNQNDTTTNTTNTTIENDDTIMDALMISQRIMRKENFLIALFNRNLLDFTLPIPYFSKKSFFCKTLEWSLYFCILNFMFNHKYQIRPAFYLDPNSLKRRFITFGIIHAIYTPFLLLFLTFHFVLQNVYDWKSTKNYFGPRDWSLQSHWFLREFNELQHNYEKRIQPSYPLAEKYLSLFGKNEYMLALGRILVFMSGSLGSVLFLFAAINDSILLHVKIADWNLLWYVGVVGTIYSVGKSMLPKEGAVDTTASSSRKRMYHRNLFGEMNDTLYEVSTYTHYYPDVWHKRGWDSMTYQAFSKMFQYKTNLFVLEIVSVIVAPIILCTSLPNCAESICEFILAIKYEIHGTGDICGYSTFDFDKFTDEWWEGRTMGSRNTNNTSSNDNYNSQAESMQDPRMQENEREEEPIDPLHTSSHRQQHHPPPNNFVAGSLSESIMKTGNVHVSTQHIAKPKARQGKMEKSFFSFKAAHPSWKCSESGKHLVDRVEQYQREEEAAALHRERELHIGAAARQLETLLQLEQMDLQLQQRRQQQPEQQIVPGLQVMDEEYVTKAAAVAAATTTTTMARTGSADAGAGSVRPPGLSVPRTEPPPPPPPPPPVPLLPETLTTPPLALDTSGMDTAGTSMGTGNSSLPQRRPPANHHAASLALSTELMRILNMSTLDPEVSVTAAAGGGGGRVTDEDEPQRFGERQYIWLERYHAHMAATQRESAAQRDGPYVPPPSSMPLTRSLIQPRRQQEQRRQLQTQSQQLYPSQGRPQMQLEQQQQEEPSQSQQLPPQIQAQSQPQRQQEQRQLQTQSQQLYVSQGRQQMQLEQHQQEQPSQSQQLPSQLQAQSQPQRQRQQQTQSQQLYLSQGRQQMQLEQQQEPQSQSQQLPSQQSQGHLQALGHSQQQFREPQRMVSGETYDASANTSVARITAATSNSDTTDARASNSIKNDSSIK